MSKTPPTCKKGAITWWEKKTSALGRGNPNENRVRAEGRRVTWKESSNVVHSLLHRSDRTAMAAMENVRLTRIPI